MNHPSPPNQAETTPAWIAEALRAEELAGLRLAVRARAVVMTAIALMIMLLQPFPYSAVNAGLMLLFAGLGGLHYLAMVRFATAWPGYVFPSLDVILYVLMLFLINPAMWPGLQPEMLYAYASSLFLLVLMATAALSYVAGPLIWFGGFAAAIWFLAFIWIVRDPDAAAALAQAQGLQEAQFAVAIPRIIEACYFLLGATVLAVVVARSRRLVTRQAAAMRERTNLARYFSPNMVEELARTDEPLGAVRQQEVAVLFIDIVGFTTLSEDLPPHQVIDLLRDFQGRMSARVFAHGGTIDKYLGDGLMATFGTPWPGERDAADALACGAAMAAELGQWNAIRNGQGAEAVEAGIGIHYGPVVVGDMGGEGAMEFAVIGDTVNVAARLEALSRSLEADIVISAELAAAARNQGEDGAVLDAFQPAPPQTLRNRTQAVELLFRPRPARA
ncbi:MAG: adenylate/guanylate cyclase domain-containing protein [Alphaproteobacteria bacterium]|nr:adenylate/guanylate cyclase domain-containing protein [Alphaproteobacteria bacterium]